MRKTSDIIWQDTQHQVLFDILDVIKRPEPQRSAFLRLKDYTEYHFTLEERYMVVFDYPEREQHLEAHNTFRLEVGQLLQADERDDQVRAMMATYLTEWFKRHVFGIDKELEAFLLESRVR